MRRIFTAVSLVASFGVVVYWLGRCVWYLIGRLGDWLLGE